MGGFVWSGFESDLFLWVMGWVWRAWVICVGGWSSSFFSCGFGDPEGVVFEGEEGIGCATHGCVALLLLNSVTIWVMTGSSSPVRVYRSWMRDSCSAWRWVWRSVEDPPW